MSYPITSSPRYLLAAISTEPPPKKGETSFFRLSGNSSTICPTAKLFPPAYLMGDTATLLYIFLLSGLLLLILFRKILFLSLKVEKTLFTSTKVSWVVSIFGFYLVILIFLCVNLLVKCLFYTSIE